MMLKLWTIGLVLAMGCSRGGDDKSAKPTDDKKEQKEPKEGAADLDALAKLKDDLCACKDAACGKAIEDKMTAKLKEMESTYADSRNKSIMHYALESDMAAKECLFKLK